MRAGAKPDPLGEILAAGRPVIRLEDPFNEPFDFAGNDIGDGAVLAGGNDARTIELSVGDSA